MKRVIGFVVAWGVIGSGAMAQEQVNRISRACRAEIVALCGVQLKDHATRRQCMKENRAKVSESCRAELKARHAARKAARQSNPAR
jgi:predicted homoserine dehydrogenase-like protein